MRALMMVLAASAAIFVSACAPKKAVEVPKTELPKLPASATLPCEALTDDEVTACIRDDQNREICRKLGTNCARYKNLQSFVKRTWTARDGK